MVSLGFPAEKIHVIYNSLCARDEVPALRSSLKSDIYIKHFGNADPVLFFSGRLTSVKRIDMLLTAVIRLNAEGCHCNAVLVGDGAERQKLETMVSRAGLGDRVWFYGKCYDESHAALVKEKEEYDLPFYAPYYEWQFKIDTLGQTDRYIVYSARGYQFTGGEHEALGRGIRCLGRHVHIVGIL